ncbi:MAG: fibronectin type III domain-containing protein, partial [Eubacterium sp.]|nr:fibronectin type III domain-containing protein [Eubacterium sp.]
MKGKRTLKRILAIVMAVAFTVTGITFTPSNDVQAYTWTQVKKGNATVGDWYFWSEWDNNFSYDTTTNGFSLNKTAAGGNTWSWQIGEKISDKKDTNGNTITAQAYDYTISFDCKSGGGTLNYQMLSNATNNYTISSGVNTITGTATYTAGKAISGVEIVDYFQLYYLNQNTILENFEVEITPHAAVSTTAGPTTSDAQGYYNALVDGSWHTVPSNGFQYKLNAGMTGSQYKGGTSISDPLHMKVVNYAADEGALQTKTPVVSVTAGRRYKLTYNVANTGSLNQGANTIFAAVTNASDDQDIVNSYSSKVGVNAGDDVDIELEYTAPASGQVYFRLVVGWANITEFVLTPENEDITVDWIPTTNQNTAIGSNGIKLFNEWPGNTEYFDGSLTSLSSARLKHVATQQTDPDYYYGEAIRIPNNVAYSSCTAQHKYRMTFTFTASQAGGKAILYQNGYNQGAETTIAAGTNTITIDFESNANVNTNTYNTEFQFANATQDTEFSGMGYTFTEMPRPVEHIYGTSAGGNSLAITWEPAADIHEDYEVTLLNAAGTSTVDGPYTVAYADAEDGYTFTGLTAGTTYTAKVVSKMNGFSSTAVTETFTVDPWVPTSTEVTPIGGANSGIDLYNAWTGNTHYYVGTTSSLANLQVKQTAAAQTNPDYYYAEAIRIKNDVAYASCTNEHLYKMTVTFNSSVAGGTAVVYQNGYNQGVTQAVESGTNTFEIEFVSNSAVNTNAYNTQIQFAGAPQGAILDHFAYSFEELPRPVEHIYGTSSSGNTLAVTWAPAAGGLSQNYEVTLLNEAGTTIVDGPYTVTAAQAAAGYTFTGLTGGTTYTAKVVGVLNGNRSTAVTETFTVDPWVPTSTASTAVGSDGTYIFNEWPGNTHYYVGTTSSLANLQVKQTADPQVPTYYYAEAIRIPNSVAYASRTNGHKYRLTVTFNASAAGGTAVVWQDGYGQGDTDTVVSGTNTFTCDFVDNTAVNTSSNFLQIQFAGVAKNTVLDHFAYSFEEIPREVEGVGAGSSIGLTNAGGKYVSTSWTPTVTMTGEEYEVSLLNSSGTILNTVTVPITSTEYKFQDGTTDDNGRTITISPNTDYKTQVVSKVGTEKSTPVPSDVTTNTGVWMRMGSVGQSPAEDVLNVANNARVSSFWGNLYYRYDHTSSLSDLILKKTSNPETDDPAIYYFHRVGQKNSAIFGNTENGAKVRLTVSYNTSANAGGTIILQQKHGSDYTNTKHTVVPNMTGANKDSFYVDFDYYTADQNEYTDLVLGELTANSEISGIEFSVTVLEHWTAGTADGGWHDVGNYAYHLPDDQAGYYSTDTSNRFSLKVDWLNWTEWNGRWGAFYVGTNEKTVYPGSVYSYSINFNRTVPNTDSSGDPPQNKVYLHVLYDNGTDLEIGNAVCDASGNASYSGEITIPDDATTARLYWVCQWPAGNERLSVDPNSGDAYTFQEVWRAVDKTQEVRDGKYKFVDKDGGAMQYKPTQTSGTGSCDVRVAAGFTDPWVPYLKTNFAEGDYGVNFVEGNEYVATITFDSNRAITTDGYKGIRFSDYNAGQPNSIALNNNEFEITFVYKDGYDITAGLGWLGESNMILSNFNVAVREGAPTMPLTNDGTNVVANWAGMPEAVGATKLVYVSYGELKIVDVTGQTSYTFPSEFYPDNDTEVELYDSYTSTEVHGEKLLRATALADMTILDARVDGIAHANTNNIIKLTIKNIGTGMITCADDYRQQFIYIVARQGDWKNYKYLCPDPHDGKTPHDPIFMKPNQV